MATAVESAMRETFERVDAGASQSYPMQCGDLYAPTLMTPPVFICCLLHLGTISRAWKC